MRDGRHLGHACYFDHSPSTSRLLLPWLKSDSGIGPHENLQIDEFPVQQELPYQPSSWLGTCKWSIMVVLANGPQTPTTMPLTTSHFLLHTPQLWTANSRPCL